MKNELRNSVFLSDQYEAIFNQILNTSAPDPIVAVMDIAHMNRIRAGLSRVKKQKESIDLLLHGSSILAEKQFSYEYLDNPKGAIRISLTKKERTEFELLNPTIGTGYD